MRNIRPRRASASTGFTVATSNASNFGRSGTFCANPPSQAADINPNRHPKLHAVILPRSKYPNRMTHPAAFSWHGKRVFLTGHTGFKGGWLALWLASKGAIVRGYALDPCTEPNLFTAARIGSLIEDIRGDIRDPSTLEPALKDFAPEVVFHMAAQPLVRYSYQDPIGTYETNVIGTARVLDAIRRTPSVRAVVSVTTDKCYENIEDPHHAYKETDPLGGYDPYSSSKACAEIVSAAYRQSYFPVSKLAEHKCAIATRTCRQRHRRRRLVARPAAPRSHPRLRCRRARAYPQPPLHSSVAACP